MKTGFWRCEAVIEAIKKHGEEMTTGKRKSPLRVGYGLAHKHIIELLDILPASDVKPDEGEWRKLKYWDGVYVCSNCGKKTWSAKEYDYCPNCGAFMKGEAK